MAFSLGETSGHAVHSAAKVAAAAPVTPTLPRLGYLDSVRAVAALFVVLHHTWMLVWHVEYGRAPAGIARLLTGWLFFGQFAVVAFIAISGFCLMLPVIRADGELRGGTLQFYKRRAWRILPPLYCAMALSLFFVFLLYNGDTGTLWDLSSHLTTSGVLANVLLVQNLFGVGQINYVFWSIAVECQIYLLFPLIIWGYRRFGTARTAAVVLAMAAITFQLTRGHRLFRLHPGYLAVFVLGGLAARVSFGHEAPWRRARERAPWLLLTAALAGGVVAVCTTLGWLR